MASPKKITAVKQRPPVIAVLGHVDHGKTTLLDYIRKATIASREAGGITQAIGAYEIEHSKKRITFIDTPGHEAFSAMRSRGARVADIAILLVAATDGVKPQTKEAINIIKETNTPFIVAINKTDAKHADVDKTKNELTAEGVLLEGYGGNVSFQPISAKTGEGVDELLDLLLLATELTELPYDETKPGTGIILEAEMDARRGIVASGVILDGTLSTGEYIKAGSAVGKIKGMQNFLGKVIKEAIPSSPVLLLGFETLPVVGETFTTQKSAFGVMKKIVPEVISAEIAPQNNNEEIHTLRLMLKASDAGSLEALTQIIEHLPRPKQIDLIIADTSVGVISDNDIKTAIATGVQIVGFKIKASKAAQIFSEAHNVKMYTSEIIYEVTQALEGEFKRLDKTIVKGDLEILGVFGKK